MGGPLACGDLQLGSRATPLGPTSGLARLDSRPVVVRRLARVRWLAVATVEAVATYTVRCWSGMERHVSSAALRTAAASVSG